MPYFVTPKYCQKHIFYLHRITLWKSLKFPKFSICWWLECFLISYNEQKFKNHRENGRYVGVYVNMKNCTIDITESIGWLVAYCCCSERSGFQTSQVSVARWTQSCWRSGTGPHPATFAFGASGKASSVFYSTKIFPNSI